MIVLDAIFFLGLVFFKLKAYVKSFSLLFNSLFLIIFILKTFFIHLQKKLEKINIKNLKDIGLKFPPLALKIPA